MKKLQKHIFGRCVLLSFVFVLCSVIPLFAEFVFAKTVFRRFIVQNSIFAFKLGERFFATALLVVLAIVSVVFFKPQCAKTTLRLKALVSTSASHLLSYHF